MAGGRAVSLGHVSVVVDDLEEAVRFYEEALGLTRLPAPTFGSPVAWLRCGAAQVHLSQQPHPGGRRGHFAVEVEDFGAVYRHALGRGCLVRDGEGRCAFELPGGEAQLYLLDPSGNVVEVDHPDAARWRADVPELVPLADVFPPRPDAHEARLFHDRP